MARSASGATRRSSGCSAAGPSRGFAARSSRSSPQRSGASCPRGMGLRRSGRTRPRCGARRRWSAWPRSSTSCLASRSRPPLLERDVLPARVPGYQPRLLDELGALGELAWVGRGSLGRRRWAGGPLPARSRGPEAVRATRRRRAAVRSAARGHPRAPGAARRVLLSRAPRRFRRGTRSRRPRRPVGPRLGGRGDRRHVRSPAGAALEAARPLDGQTSGRAADIAGTARGGRPMVADRGSGGRDRNADGTSPRDGPRRCSNVTASWSGRPSWRRAWSAASRASTRS